MLWTWLNEIALADPGVLPPPADSAIYLTGGSAMVLFLIGLATGIFCRITIPKTVQELQDKSKLKYLEQLVTVLNSENRTFRNAMLGKQNQVVISKEMALFIIKNCHPDLNPNETKMASEVTKWALNQKKQVKS